MKQSRIRYLIVTIILTLLLPLLSHMAEMTVQATEISPTLRDTSIILYSGEENYQIRFYNCGNSALINYESSKPSVATVSEKGIIQPLKKGTATITATVEELGYTYVLTMDVTVKTKSAAQIKWENTVIKWKDPAIESYIRNIFDNPCGDIKVKDLGDITALQLQNKGVETIEDLQ